MFLAMKGARTGAIKGESQDTQHKGEIDVLGWSWGMQAKASVNPNSSTGPIGISELKILKKADTASTALMAALRSNEPIKEAILTVRKSAPKQVDYLKITIEQGRVTSLNIEAGDTQGSSDVFERVSISFNKITVEYVPQGSDGQPLGGMTFIDQIGQAP
jgi:type VI secretion system secreted protein Hcp